MESAGKTLAALDDALMRAPAQKALALDLGISEGELSKQINNLKKAARLLDRLGLQVVPIETMQAYKRLLKDCL